MKRTGMLAENFNLTPKGDQSGRGSCLIGLEGQYSMTAVFISSRANLNETSKAKTIGVMS